MDPQSNSTDNTLPPEQHAAGEMPAGKQETSNIPEKEVHKSSLPNESVMEVHHHAHHSDTKNL